MCWLSPECECSGVLVFPVLARFSFCERKALGWEPLRRCRRARALSASCGAAGWAELTCVVRLLFSQGAGGRAVREPRGRV